LLNFAITESAALRMFRRVVLDRGGGVWLEGRGWRLFQALHREREGSLFLRDGHFDDWIVEMMIYIKSVGKVRESTLCRV